MIKQISLIALVAIGIATVFIGTSHAPAFAACTGNPHAPGSTGNPHDAGDTGNPHDSGFGRPPEGDFCNGAK